jgi:hypothetical protein
MQVADTLNFAWASSGWFLTDAGPVMQTTLLTPAQWAQLEFGSARLGDRRRTKRLVNLATHLAQQPGGTLPQVFPDWKELKGAYRFLSQGKAGWEQIQRVHVERTQAACRQAGEYLLIEDTTELDYTGHPATEELGQIGNEGGRGLLLHSTLAFRVQSRSEDQRPQGVVVGLFGQACWSRKGPSRRGTETWRQRVKRPRESERWAAVLTQVPGPPAQSRWIYIADREADFYEPMQRCSERGIHFVIRAYRDRKLSQQSGHLKASVARAPLLGRMAVELRSRPGQSARTAVVELRACALQLVGPWRPGGQRPDFGVNVVEAREVDAPAGAEPLYWLLLTSLPCGTLAEARAVIGYYTARWWVEEYHKALKTGVGVEESQLERAYRLEALVAVLAIVALRLLNAKWLARALPDEEVDAQVFGPQALEILEKKWGRPQGGWTHRSVLIATARLGGFLARKHDGLPGWQTIWRGWRRLMWMCEGLEALGIT